MTDAREATTGGLPRLDGAGRVRDRAELWTWRLLAEISRALPVRRVIQTHAGGGLYDTVEVWPSSDEAAPRIRVNRPGSVHLSDLQNAEALDLLSALDAGLPLADAAARVAAALGAPRGKGEPDPRPLQLMAELLARGMAARPGVWRWRNGQNDDTWSAGRRDELFACVPAAARDCSAVPSDLLGCPEYRFWFLTLDDVALLGVDPLHARLYLDEQRFSVAAPDGVRNALERVGAIHQLTGATPKEQMTAARAAFASLARRLAAAVAGDVTAFQPGRGRRLTARAEWFTAAEGQRLVAAMGDHEPRGAAAEVLAYALAWQHDRDLVLVLPEDLAGPVLARLAWVETPVRVFTYWHDLVPRPAAVPPQDEVLAAARRLPLRAGDVHDLDARAPWVEALTRAADRHWALVAAHRSSYLAWHCAGRQVLSVTRITAGVRVRAGVQYGKPAQGQPQPLILDIVEPLSAAERARIEAVVAGAVADRLTGADHGHVEHRMQAALAVTELRDLGMDRAAREYPAWRADGHPGFIDFLGLDDRNQLHVVETKVGPDVGIVLQALDYAIWVAARAPEIRRQLSWPDGRPNERVHIDLVLAPKGVAAAVDPYLSGQLAALHGSVGWRIALVADPLAEAPALTVWPARRVTSGSWAAPSVAPSRWAAVVDASLRKPDGPLFHVSTAAALSGTAEAAYLDIQARGLAHRYALHVRSSQAFALNLFGPLTLEGIGQVLARLGLPAVEVQPVTFEYSDPADRLREARPTSPHSTQVDVLLRGTAAAGRRLAALIEVKFTEIDFGACSAWDNPANPWRDNCRTLGLFGGSPGRCFQLANHGTGPRRLYDEALRPIQVTLPTGAADPGGCLVRAGLNQPMRNLALARTLLDAQEIDRGVYALCAPTAHPTIWRRFDEFRAAFADAPDLAVSPLPAETVAALHPDGGQAFRERYPLFEV